MTDIPTTAPTPPDPLQLDRCPDCGYLFTGLPDRGICPECGFAYNPDMIVLYGWAHHLRAKESNRYSSRFRTGLLWFARIAFLLFVLVPALMRQAWSSLTFPAVVIAILLVSTFRRKQLLEDAPAPVQLRLFPEGFSQRDGIGQVTLRPWRAGKHLRLKRMFNGRYRIRTWRWYMIVLLRKRHVDFEFHAFPGTPGRIQERIDRWRTAQSVESQIG